MLVLGRVKILRDSGLFRGDELFSFSLPERIPNIPMTDPWKMVYLYLHEWLIFMVNVGN